MAMKEWNMDSEPFKTFWLRPIYFPTAYFAETFCKL